MSIFGWQGREARVNHPDADLRIALVVRRPNSVRHEFPVPAAGQTMFRVLQEVEVTGCSAVFRLVRRVGSRTERQEQQIDLRALTGRLSGTGPRYALREGAYGTLRTDEGDGRPYTAPIDATPYEAGPGELGYDVLALIAWVRQNHCGPQQANAPQPSGQIGKPGVATATPAPVAPPAPEQARSACGDGTPEQSVAACTASLARGNEPPPRQAGMLILRGEALRQLNQPDRAHADYTASLQIMPTFRAHFGRGIIAVDRNEFEAALADLNAADRITPNNFEVLGYRGMAHQGRGDLAWALAEFEASIRNGGSSLAILVEERDRVRAQLARNPLRSIGVDDIGFGLRLTNALTAAGLPPALRDDACVQPRCRWRVHAIPGVVITTVRGAPETADLRQIMVEVASSVHGNTAGRIITLMMEALSPTTTQPERTRAAMALAPNGDPMTSPPAEASLAGMTWRRERNIVTVGLAGTPVQASPQAPAAAPADPLVGQWFWTGARPTQRGGIVISRSVTPNAYVASFDWDMDGQRSGTSQIIQRQPDGTLRFSCLSGQCYRTGVETVATGRLRADGGLLEMFIHENGRLATNLEYRRAR